MRLTIVLIINAIAVLSGCGRGFSEDSASFDVEEVRAAERAVIEALQAPDSTAWVYHYTEDAVLVEPGEEPVVGRQALLDMAKNMKPLSSVVISPARTEGAGNLAYVYGTASWMNGRPPDEGTVSNVRVVMIWRKEPDGQWRIAHEMFSPI